MTIDSHTLARLRSQIARGEIILFTGAGFSVAAKSRQGEPIPTTGELREALWRICFPTEPLDSDSSLGDLFDLARARQPQKLAQLLERRLSVDPESLPDFYRDYFAFPWRRWYTLNIDDLPLAAARKFDLPRRVSAISATFPSSDSPTRQQEVAQLEVIHLNGMIPGPPITLTFSETQYAHRIANQEPLYSQCVAELMSRPIIFIGTELHEPPLWQHMELRRRRGSAGRDLRPTSLLVTPSLNAARRELLRELRIDWIAGTAEEFAQQVLRELRAEAQKGFEFFAAQTRLSGRVTIPLVSELSSQNPNLETDYLRGSEPHWADLINGRAIERADDGLLYKQARAILSGDRPNTALAVTGTAGNGKSTALMRMSLRLSGGGTPVLWVDRESEAGPTLMRETVRQSDGPIVLAIDDADLYGRQLVNLLRDLVPGREKFLFVFGVRATKLDEISVPIARSGELDLLEHAVPNLTDDDIDQLIETLDRHNRLGVLKGKSATERRLAFAEQAGRQLLVAMIQATSDRKFEEKVHDELKELDGDQRYVYSLVSLASAFRHYLMKDEVLLACGDRREEALQALDRLTARHVLVAQPPEYRYRARHRVVANLVVEKLQQDRELIEIVKGLAFAAASKVSAIDSRNNRLWRLAIQLLNHDFLLRVVGIMDARRVYEELESLLNFDYHYWLQRGSLEVEAGGIALAENFLNQSRSLAPDDYRVETEYAYMLIRRAYEQAGAPDAQATIDEALQILDGVISLRGEGDPYPFHVLGSQGLAWTRRAALGVRKKQQFLERLVSQVRKGAQQHPQRQDLVQLLRDLERELLMTTVPRSESS